MAPGDGNVDFARCPVLANRISAQVVDMPNSTHPQARLLVPATCRCSFAFVCGDTTKGNCVSASIQMAGFLKSGFLWYSVAVVLGISSFLKWIFHCLIRHSIPVCACFDSCTWPHTVRSGYLIRHDVQTDVRFVSYLLGHSSAGVTSHQNPR